MARAEMCLCIPEKKKIGKEWEKGKGKKNIATSFPSIVATYTQKSIHFRSGINVNVRYW